MIVFIFNDFHAQNPIKFESAESLETCHTVRENYELCDFITTDKTNIAVLTFGVIIGLQHLGFGTVP